MKLGNYRILIVDDDESVRDMLGIVVKDFGKLYFAKDGEEARKKFQEIEFDMVLLDFLLPDTNGLELLREFLELQPRIQIIMISHVRDVKTAVQAMKLGAYDYLNKDFEEAELRAILLRVIDKIQSKREIYYLRSEVDPVTDQEFIIGNSVKMRGVKEVLDRAACTDATVLLIGESGTGKELAARYLHRHSLRSDKPFIAVNMASIPDNLAETTLFGHEKGSFTGALKTTYGKFELADGGTLFLDEITDLKLELQSKLLRAMQESEVERVGAAEPIHVDVRIIAATNRDLRHLVEEGIFREDLYYRLNVIPLKLPKLAERIEDIPSFVDLFLKRYNRKFGRSLTFSPEALTVICQYDWPGNIRELENLIARLVAIHPSNLILPDDIPVDYQFSEPSQLKDQGDDSDYLRAATDAFERGFILRVLEKENWHQENTAVKLGIHRKTLEYKLKKLRLNEVVDQRKRESKNY